MQELKIGFVGMGKMGKILAKKLHNLELHDGKIKVVWYDPYVEEGPGEKKTKPEELSEADVIILAVKPSDFDDAVAELGSITKHKVIISIAAGISSNIISTVFSRWARVMPSVLAEVEESVFAVLTPFDDIFSICEKIFSLFGEVIRVRNDEEIDIFTTVSASGPGYLSLLFEAFEDAVVKIGLPRPLARKLCARTFLGTAKLILSGKSPTEIKYNVMTPAGTTAEGVKILTQIQHYIFESVEKVYEKCKIIRQNMEEKYKFSK